MELLRTTCHSCGPVEVGLRRAVLRLNTDDGTGVCAVRCHCGMRINREVETAMIVMLLAAGIEVELWGSDDTDQAIMSAEPIDAAELDRFRAQLLDDHAMLHEISGLAAAPNER